MLLTMPIYSDSDNYYSEMKEDIENGLDEFVSNLSDLQIQPNIEYSIERDENRMKPLILALCNYSLGGNFEYIKPLAVAFEFLHTAELIHEDIMSNDSHRIENKVIGSDWSQTEAVLTSEALMTISMNISSRYNKEVVKQISNYSMRLTSGQTMFKNIDLDTSIEEYIKLMAERSYLFRTAGYCAAILTDCDNELDIMKVTKSAKKFGIAYQIYEDMYYIKSSEFKKPKITLPILHCYQEMGSEDKKGLKQDINVLKMEDSKFTSLRLKRNLEEHGSLKYCKEKADEYFRDSVKLLNIFNEEAARGLESIAEMVKDKYENLD